MDTPLLLFSVLVFVAVFLVVEGLISTLFGSERQHAKQVKRRLQKVDEGQEQRSAVSLLRDEYTKERSRVAGWVEALPGIAALARLIEQSGSKLPAHRVLLRVLLLGAGAFAAAWSAFPYSPVPFVALGVGGMLPPLQVLQARKRRLQRFEEQLPEALDIVTRSLRAGHPFNESLLLVAEELQGPVAEEFGLVFSEINYGMEMREAFGRMQERVPSQSLRVLITSVLVQRETGGNLAEILGNISAVIRGRFRFQRKVRTLSAEGRLSGWILVAVPFGLFGLLSLTSPDYAAELIKNPEGKKLVGVALVLMAFGALWIRKLVRLDV